MRKLLGHGKRVVVGQGPLDEALHHAAAGGVHGRVRPVRQEGHQEAYVALRGAGDAAGELVSGLGAPTGLVYAEVGHAGGAQCTGGLGRQLAVGGLRRVVARGRAEELVLKREALPHGQQRPVVKLHGDAHRP